jgi:hypothetical protein
MEIGTISVYRKGSTSDLVGNAAAYDVDLRQIHMHTYITTVAAIALTSPYGVYIFHFKKASSAACTVDIICIHFNSPSWGFIIYINKISASSSCKCAAELFIHYRSWARARACVCIFMLTVKGRSFLRLADKIYTHTFHVPFERYTLTETAC